MMVYPTGAMVMSSSVCLVIPARNAADTVEKSLAAARLILERGDLQEIILVDDGSADNTAELAKKMGVTCLRSKPLGRSAARNLGWKKATQDIIWFMDVDCVPEPDALACLLKAYDDPSVGGVGGSFTMPDEAPLLACLIHQEIIQRHQRMPNRVNFVATGNASYRREVLEHVGGFDEGFIRAQDAELSYRVRAAGYEIAFSADSRVRHFHDTKLRPYLKAQFQQGYWRVWLHARHASHATGDSYSSLLDNLQPPLAMLVLALAVFSYWPAGRWGALAAACFLVLMPVPMALKLVQRTGKLKYLCYIPFSFCRAFARGAGLTLGSLCYLFRIRRVPPSPVPG